MLQTLSSCFSRKAGAVFLAGAMLASHSGCSSEPEVIESVKGESLNISQLVPTGKSCVFLEAAKNPKTPVARYLARQYAETQETKIGRMLFDTPKSDPMIVCYDRALDQENTCGGYRLGLLDNNALYLNPAERVSDKRRTLTSVHEMRHRFQSRIHVDFSNGKNVRERERVAAYWLIEADARMTAILYAFEKGEKGDDSYRAVLSSDQKMVDVFYGVLNPERSNVVEAARASVLGFLQQADYTMIYANNTLDWIDRNKMGFDPYKKETPILNAKALLKMGNIGYGNYMTPDVIEAFSKTFSEESFQTLKAARAVKGGRVCKL